MITLDEAGRGIPNYRIGRPRDWLGEFAEHVWAEDLSRAVQHPGRAWRIVPDDAPHLIWHLYERNGVARPGIRLVGARSTFVDIDRSKRIATIGIRLRPGVVKALFRVSGAELTDRSVALDDVLTGRARQKVRDAAESMAHLAHALPAAAHVMECLLADLAGGAGPVDPRVPALARLTSASPLRLRDATSALGIGVRMLRSVIRAETGLGAREFVRIRRLHRALHLGLEGRGNWAQAAAAAGYADQAHLNRECRALLGETPAAFAGRALPR